MPAFWNFILIFSTMLESGGRWVSAESLTKSPVYQPDKELSVDIGDSATLRCCISEKQYGMVTWFKQPTRKKPQTIVRSFVTAGDTFNDGFNESHFQIERSTNCINLSILNTFQSDEATYYCAVTRPNIVFAEGTYLKINETSISVVCEPTLHENINSQEKTVLSLGMALGLCALLISCLIYFLLRRRKCDQMKPSIASSSAMRQKRVQENIIQESDSETLNYAGLQFPKRKPKADKWKTGFSEHCIYTDVKYN
ncbi:uncharacterized protein LOC124385745 isoform X2 [Silurus meridionalis]|uniref:uncharacterized protein LOC124385745 isoform X2 n=1 Tax=Silurus meridionalis TaxID=175797 RepID=UPI001EEB8CD6|nr:uncharacterized protein LOC124385745 isoform X2 [Silurus meridionalis]